MFNEMYRLSPVAVINPYPDIIPICNNSCLEPGRYAVQKTIEGDYLFYERGNISDKDYMYYDKEIKVYGDNSVYIYDNCPMHGSKEQFNAKRLYNNEMKVIKKREKELQKQIQKVHKKNNKKRGKQ